jgi:hypothetical protein
MCAYRHKGALCAAPGASSQQTKMGLWYALREQFASLLHPAIWLRAWSLAALRDRSDAAAFGIAILPPDLLEQLERLDALTTASGVDDEKAHSPDMDGFCPARCHRLPGRRSKLSGNCNERDAGRDGRFF